MDILRKTPRPLYICITDSESISSVKTTCSKYYYHEGSGMAKPFIVTSMKVDEDLWKRAKKRAIDEEITLQQLLNVAVQEYLRRGTMSDFRRKKREN